MFHQFMLIQDKTRPTKYHVEIDGKPVNARSIDIHVGINEIPTVKVELLASPVAKMEADIKISGDNA